MRSISSASEELTILNPPGKRQEFATTTIKNGLNTLLAVHQSWKDAQQTIRRVKNMSWRLVLQPLLPRWASKDDPSPLWLNDTEEALVNVSFTVNWTEARDDEFVKATARRVVEEIDAFVLEHGTGLRFRYLNYCAGWQKSYESYGEQNLQFLRGTSKKYDPDGLFQRGFKGGFKLDMQEE